MKWNEKARARVCEPRIMSNAPCARETCQCCYALTWNEILHIFQARWNIRLAFSKPRRAHSVRETAVEPQSQCLQAAPALISAQFNSLICLCVFPLCCSGGFLAHVWIDKILSVVTQPPATAAFTAMKMHLRFKFMWKTQLIHRNAWEYESII